MTPLWIRDHPPRQGLGLMRLRDSGQNSNRDPVTLVHTALDSGITLLDTAEMYGNEELVGRAIAGRRDEVTICSKFGIRWGDSGRFDDWSIHADPATVVSSCEGSLRRLGVETIDLYYLHHRSEETPIEETVTAMAGLVSAGKIRAIGLSNVTVDDVRRAHEVHPVLAVQEAWSLAARDVEAMLPTLAELGITLVAHSPTGHGVLHGSTDTPLGAVLAEVAHTRGNARPSGSRLGPPAGTDPGPPGCAATRHDQRCPPAGQPSRRRPPTNRRRTHPSRGNQLQLVLSREHD